MPTASKPTLTPEQWELVGQFNDESFENPKLSFEEVAAKLGARFSDTPEGRLFEKECRACFDLERQPQDLPCFRTPI
jgi:hypothetical protein